MHSKTFIPFLISQVAALGCYSGGLGFNALHGGKQDLDQEVKNDISTTCQMVDGATFKKGDGPFTHCSEWEVTEEPDDSCFYDCQKACGAVGFIPGPGALVGAVCSEGCDPNCGGPPLGSMNHLSWEIKHANGDDETVLTYDACVKAFEKELGGCSTGSEQNHDGFFYKIDPNAGTC